MAPRMIEIRKVQTLIGHRRNLFIPSDDSILIHAEHLMLFPALIDPHVHFRTPGAESKEDWMSGAKAAISGGVTTVLDMPNNTPACSTRLAFHAKEKRINEQLLSAKLPLHYHLYFGADQRHLNELATVKNQVIALKIYMGSSTGDLLMHEPQALKDAFQIAAENDVLIAVHAEDEDLMRQRAKILHDPLNPATHSLVRSPSVAAAAIEQALFLAEQTKARLYICHVSTQAELDLIRAAKKKGLQVFAEATPHHLFLNDTLYEHLGTRALVNPPLRSPKDVEALWEALSDGTIDTIGTDHAPHTLQEKMQPFGKAPSGFPSIEFYFPLLLNAADQKRLTLEQIASLTHTRPQEIFRLPLNDDIVLVDLAKSRTISEPMIRSKAGWSPYLGHTLKGWPRYVACNGKWFDLEKL